MTPPDLGVQALDEVRTHIAKKMKGLRPNLIIDTIFTADETWATGAMDDVGSP